MFCILLIFCVNKIPLSFSNDIDKISIEDEYEMNDFIKAKLFIYKGNETKYYLNIDKQKQTTTLDNARIICKYYYNGFSEGYFSNVINKNNRNQNFFYILKNEKIK